MGGNVPRGTVLPDRPPIHHQTQEHRAGDRELKIETGPTGVELTLPQPLLPLLPGREGGESLQSLLLHVVRPQQAFQQAARGQERSRKRGRTL